MHLNKVIGDSKKGAEPSFACASYHSEGRIVFDSVLGHDCGSCRRGFHGGLLPLALHLPLAALLLELLAMGVGPGRVVDQGELEQGAEDERQAHAGPHVDGLSGGWADDAQMSAAVGGRRWGTALTLV